MGGPSARRLVLEHPSAGPQTVWRLSLQRAFSASPSPRAYAPPVPLYATRPLHVPTAYRMPTVLVELPQQSISH